jgi:hypothetical protein
MERIMKVISAKHIRRAALGFVSTAVIGWSAMGAENSASIPALSGHWGRTNFNLEQPASGPKFIANILRKPDGTIDDDTARVGDFTNPILKPEAAEILRKHGEFSRTGQSIPDPHNQCWPEPPPFVMTIQVQVLLLQQKDEVTLVYVNGQIVRHVRLNVPHAEHVTPTWLGDSVGHYEGDTLVIDTVAIKPSRWPVVDRYGTPHSDALHVVERYRLIDGEAAAEAIRNHRRNFTTNTVLGRFDIYGAEYDPDTSHKGLQVEVTVDDSKMFTAPWKGLVTYRPETAWPEMICADSLRESTGPDRAVPVADKPDF